MIVLEALGLNGLVVERVQVGEVETGGGLQHSAYIFYCSNRLLQFKYAGGDGQKKSPGVDGGVFQQR